MAEDTLVVPAFVDRLAEALKTRLPGAEVRYEHVRGKRYRFVVVWKQFDAMDHPERQEIVWDLADRELPGEDLLNVAMIFEGVEG